MPSGALEYLTAQAGRVDAALERLIPSEGEGPGDLHRAMRHSVFAGGKRFRPVLCLASHEAAGGGGDRALPAACALEMIHTYSLIHDDLPALDDDDLRRGRPTCHKVFGEAIAILAGDALLTLAFETLAPLGGDAVRLVAAAAGTRGMIGGQVRDIESEGSPLSLEQLTRVHAEKTGALIRASCRLGGLAAGAPPRILETLDRYGEKVGLAFQIADDILNVEGNPEQIGKPVGSDARRGKTTFASLLGVDAARARMHELAADAAKIAQGSDRGRVLAELAAFSVERAL